MTWDTKCPSCGLEFTVPLYECGDCPNSECDDFYFWDEMCTEDYSDCWDIIVWNSILELEMKIWRERWKNEG